MTPLLCSSKKKYCFPSGHNEHLPRKQVEAESACMEFRRLCNFVDCLRNPYGVRAAIPFCCFFKGRIFADFSERIKSRHSPQAVGTQQILVTLSLCQYRMNGSEKACQEASTGSDPAAPVSGAGLEPPRRERGTHGAVSSRSGSVQSAWAGG